GLDVGDDRMVDHVEPGAGLGQRYSRLQAPEEIRPVVLTALEPAESGPKYTHHADRHEHQRVDAERGPLKIPRGHADDRHRLSIHAKGLTHHSRIAHEV